MTKFINKDIILVDGATASVLIDLKNEKNYRIDNILKNDIYQSLYSGNNKELIKLLKDNSILNKNDNIYNYNYKYSDTIDFSWIEITNKCNFKCIHCYNWKYCKVFNEMKYNDIVKIFKILRDFGVNRIQITGGEPLLHKDIYKILKVAAGTFRNVEIFTNGYFLTNYFLDFIKDHCINIAISLHSKDINCNDRIIGVSGATKIVLKNINMVLLKKNIASRIVSVKTSYSADDIIFDNIIVKNDPIRMTGRATVQLLTRNILQKKLIKKESFINKFDKNFIIKNMYRHTCFGRKLYIDSNLICYPCVMERRISIGNIFEDKLLDNIYKIGKYFSKENINECNLCEYRLFCYDCRPDSLSSDVFEKPWYCLYNPKTGSWTNEEDKINEFNL